MKGEKPGSLKHLTKGGDVLAPITSKTTPIRRRQANALKATVGALGRSKTRTETFSPKNPNIAGLKRTYKRVNDVIKAGQGVMLSSKELNKVLAEELGASPDEVIKFILDLPINPHEHDADIQINFLDTHIINRGTKTVEVKEGFDLIFIAADVLFIIGEAYPSRRSTEKNATAVEYLKRVLKLNDFEAQTLVSSFPKNDLYLTGHEVITQQLKTFFSNRAAYQPTPIDFKH